LTVLISGGFDQAKQPALLHEVAHAGGVEIVDVPARSSRSTAA
jgi:hypothetical protein